MISYFETEEVTDNEVKSIPAISSFFWIIFMEYLVLNVSENLQLNELYEQVEDVWIRFFVDTGALLLLNPEKLLFLFGNHWDMYAHNIKTDTK